MRVAHVFRKYKKVSDFFKKSQRVFAYFLLFIFYQKRRIKWKKVVKIRIHFSWKHVVRHGLYFIWFRYFYMVLKIEVWRVFFKMKAIEISFEFMKTTLGSIHIWRQIFLEGIFDLPTYPNQILYYINLFSKIRCKITYPPT